MAACTLLTEGAINHKEKHTVSMVTCTALFLFILTYYFQDFWVHAHNSTINQIFFYLILLYCLSLLVSKSLLQVHKSLHFRYEVWSCKGHSAALWPVAYQGRAPNCGYYFVSLGTANSPGTSLLMREQTFHQLGEGTITISIVVIRVECWR